jgi:hypothetical protein
MSGLREEVVGVRQGDKGGWRGERVGEGVGAEPLSASWIIQECLSKHH